MKNFEKYKNQNDLIQAFFANRSPSSIGVTIVQEFVKWREMEAEEEKTLPCPFCGSNTVITFRDTVRHVNKYCVECTVCNYRSEDKYQKDSAIAAHNAICRAVMAQK